MKKFLVLMCATLFLLEGCMMAGESGGQNAGKVTPDPAKKLKVMIGVDFEGIAGVVTFPEIYSDHPYFMRNVKELTAEVNAAVEGALAAGATEIIVRDGHGADQNVDPFALHPEAKLINGRMPNTPQTMVMGIDSTYDALIFIGAHAMAGKQVGILSHTMSLKVEDYKLNGVSMGECPYNALYAGQFGVPVVFVSGDDVTCGEARQFFGDIETVETKVALGRTCAVNHSSGQVCREIKEGVEKALRGLPATGKVFTMDKPYKMEVWVRDTPDSPRKYITVTSDTLMTVMQAFWDAI